MTYAQSLLESPLIPGIGLSSQLWPAVFRPLHTTSLDLCRKQNSGPGVHCVGQSAADEEKHDLFGCQWYGVRSIREVGFVLLKWCQCRLDRLGVTIAYSVVHVPDTVPVSFVAG